MSESFDKLIEIMAILRGPQGCPWDHEQNHLSIIPQLIEETYELIDAIESKNDPHFCEELGDLLLHIIFHAQMAKDRGVFDIHEVVQGLSEKLVRRHPHVFGVEEVDDAEEVMVNWDKIKATEKKNHKGTSILASVPKGLPALYQASKLSKKASKVGFDWNKAEDVLAKIDEEVAELKKAVKSRKSKNIEEEMGDIFFSLANLSRHLKVQPEEALRKTNNKFRARFAAMENILAKQKKKFDDLTLKEWEKLWERAKKERHSGGS